MPGMTDVALSVVDRTMDEGGIEPLRFAPMTGVTDVRLCIHQQMFLRRCMRIMAMRTIARAEGLVDILLRQLRLRLVVTCVTEFAFLSDRLSPGVRSVRIMADQTQPHPDGSVCRALAVLRGFILMAGVTEIRILFGQQEVLVRRMRFVASDTLSSAYRGVHISSLELLGLILMALETQCRAALRQQKGVF